MFAIGHCYSLPLSPSLDSVDLFLDNECPFLTPVSFPSFTLSSTMLAVLAWAVLTVVWLERKQTPRRLDLGFSPCFRFFWMLCFREDGCVEGWI